MNIPPFRKRPNGFLKQPGNHCAMIGIDIVGFGAAERDDETQRHVRDAMYKLLQCAFSSAGLRWQDCPHYDRGDGALIIVPPTRPTVAIIAMAVHLRVELRRHNRLHSNSAQLQLRMAVHAGPVHLDGNGLTGHAVIHLFRLLDAPSFKQLIAGSTADLGLIVSAEFYRDVICHNIGLIDAADYRPLSVMLKETSCTAWTHLP